MANYTFGVNWDYRCPFARNMHEHIITALAAGAPWEVTFIPFSLSQVHVPEDAPPVWDDPAHYNDLLANMVGMVINKEFPDKFGEIHLALFRARHDEAKDISSRDVLAQTVESCGVSSEEVFSQIAEGWPLKEFRQAHEHTVEELKVFGVPTFIFDNRAAFVRVMTRPQGDAGLARETVEYALSTLIDHPQFNEIKFTTVPR